MKVFDQVTFNFNKTLLKVTSADATRSLDTWLVDNKDEIEDHLRVHGAILFHNFQVAGTTGFANMVRVFSPTLLEYKERSTPRTEVQGNVYTSTEYPNDQIIPMHNENSYSSVWPLKIWFYCQTSPLLGGETPIADSREMFKRLDSKLKQQFVDKSVMYVRNFDGKLDLSWQDVFQTEDKQKVEQYCLANGMDYEWISPNHLRTRAIRQAVAKHPITGETVWFNQAHLFHVSSLPVEAREWLIEQKGLEGLPRNTYFGDGSIIPDSIIEEIQEQYSELSIEFPWEEGQVLLLDNMLMTHGRHAYQGKRKIVVAMTEPYSQNM